MTVEIGYRYDGDAHCVPCAIVAFGREPGARWVREDAVDQKGRPVMPVYSWDLTEPEVCADCGSEL